MQTHFTLSQLADHNIDIANKEIKKCVHCGMCTATCPTFVVLADELDSPRGRIHQIQQWLENNSPITKRFVRHIDRCLSCYSCMTTCPSGVEYRRLIDIARQKIGQFYRRPWGEKMLRLFLNHALPNPTLMRITLLMAGFARPFARILPQQLQSALELAPKKIFAPQYFAPAVNNLGRGRVIIHRACAGAVVNGDIDKAVVTVLNKLGYDITILEESQCCGSLNAHTGAGDLSAKKRSALMAKLQNLEFDFITSTASGCGSFMADAHYFGEYAQKYRDISQLFRPDYAQINPEFAPKYMGKRIAYHSACSLQHGLKITDTPKELLQSLGLNIITPKESHLCCGSAGVYNILQPALAKQLGQRKSDNIQQLQPDMVIMGNVGCMGQIARFNQTPIYHIAQILQEALT